MEDIHFSCPHCDGHIVIDGEGAGRDGPCPHCNQTIQIPMPAQEPAHAAASTAPKVGGEGLHFQKNPVETWKQHTKTDAEERSLLEHLGFDTEPDDAEDEEASGGSGSGYNAHGSDVNFDQPWQKKKDQWFTENGKRYHYCYYNPGSAMMKTACGAPDVPVSADIVPENTKLRKHAYCKKCLQVLTAH